MRTLLSILLLAAGISIASAQQGTIRGLVTDAKSGETLIGVNVAIKGTTTGTFTDLDGNFSLSVDPGTYDLQVSYVSYQSSTITGVEVKAGEVIVLNNIQLSTASLELGEVIVRAELVKNNETAMLVMKQKSVSMIDGISSEKMALTGDGNAAEAAKRVTGISIEGGKYIYVRGLGDRYSKTTLNGLEIPGLDPDRNSLQLDIFPSSLINNITVNKNFTAQMPGDFAGGLMNIETKGFPDEKQLSFSAGIGYNPEMHFNSNFLTYSGSGTDFLGFDNGQREIPIGAQNLNVPTPTSGASQASVTNFIRRFNPTLGASQESSLLDYSFSLNYGNQFNLQKEGEDEPKTLGVIASLSYKTDYSFYDDVTYGEYQRNSDPSQLELTQANLQTGEIGEKNVLLGAIAGLAYKKGLSKYRFTLTRLQSGTSRAAQFEITNNGEAVGQSGFYAVSDNLEYNERTLSNVFLGGKHVHKDEKWSIDWGVSPTLSQSEDPDIRKTAFTITPTNTFFSAGAGGNPSRIWRSLSEINIPARVDYTRKYSFQDRKANFSVGVSNTYKERDYEILFFDIQFFGSQSWENTDPNQVLSIDNIYPNHPNSIYYQSGNLSPNPNQYNSTIMNTGVYVSNELPLSKRLNSVLGIRAENFVQHHTGRDQTFASGDFENGNNLRDEEVLNTLNLLPSLNLIYAISEKQNLRLAYARTVARPSFKELSYAQIIDPITNRIFNGGLFVYTDSDGKITWDGKLKETQINNVDLRWEIFQDLGQMYSISGFYKQFNDPIELVRIPEQQASAEFQPRNVGDGTVYGIELELRKNLSALSEKLSRVALSANLTLAQSEISMTDVEYNSRLRFERTGEKVENKREMAGQSPYVINAGLTYATEDKSWSTGLFYNTKGPTLEVVGIGLYSDVYTEPFHSLNFSWNKKLGDENKTYLDFKVSNILNDRVESFYTSFNAEDQIFSSYAIGTTISVGFRHKF